MKSQKGMTMVSLILYVASFLVVTTAITSITTFFYKNVEVLDSTAGSHGQYNKFNVFMLDLCKQEGTYVLAYQNTNDAHTSNTDMVDDSVLSNHNIADTSSKLYRYITFKNIATLEKNSFLYDHNDKVLYYNNIRLCENVDNFKLDVVKTEKTVVRIYIEINGIAFSTEYVVKA